MKTLVIGIGNPGRRDDGLGPALIEFLAGSRLPERAVVDVALMLFSSRDREDIKGIVSPSGQISQTVEAHSGARPLIGQNETVETFWAYQLNVEDAETIRDYDRVIFVDAARDENESWSAGDRHREESTPRTGEDRSPAPAQPSCLEPLPPAASIAFTTHEMSPASILALAEELYGKAPAGFLLKIRGAEWDFVEGLSAEGERNLAGAEQLCVEFINNYCRRAGRSEKRH